MQSHEVILGGLPQEKFKLGTCWGLGNDLVVFPAPPTRSTSSGLRLSNVHVHNIRWETTLYEPMFRKLVNESLHVFLNLQKMAKEEEGDSDFGLSLRLNFFST